MIADSGSVDGSADMARSFGATVFGVERFSHGGPGTTWWRFAAITQGRSTVRWSGTPGSARGAVGNDRPYRNRPIVPEPLKNAPSAADYGR